jgi:YD repeat-containing protein
LARRQRAPLPPRRRPLAQRRDRPHRRSRRALRQLRLRRAGPRHEKRLAGGAERLDFAYGSDANGQPTTSVTDYSGAGGAATSRSYTFTDIGNVRYPSSLSAPCSLCGSTQQQSSYDSAGNPTRQVAHDGSVTFIAYDARGREIERATYPSSYQGADAAPNQSSASELANNAISCHHLPIEIQQSQLWKA